MKKKLRLGALISGGGTNLQAIIDACEAGSLDAEVVFVGSDNPNAGGLERAQRHSIDHFVVDYAEIINQSKQNPSAITLPANADMDQILAKQHLFASENISEKVRQFFLNRVAAEFQMLEKITPYNVDLLVLAGFMRNFSPYFIDQFNQNQEICRIMNIHPAILPSFPGIDGYGDTYRYGCKVGGCTVHFIDYGEDSGPIIGQKTFTIEEDDTLDSIEAKGLKLEWELYPECIQLFAQGRLKIVRATHTLENGRIYQRAIVKIAHTES